MPILLALILLTTLIATSTPSFAARCGGDFDTFVDNISREAQAAGVSRGVIDQALSGVTQDQAVLNFDRRQRGTFNKTFEQYVATRVGPGRVNGGIRKRATGSNSMMTSVRSCDGKA